MDDGNAPPGLGRQHLPLSPRRAPKRSEVIARELVEHVVDARLAPGTMLPREREMIDQLGVGRTTLREALRLLETRGVVTIRSGPGGGPVVRHPQPSDLTEALTLILQFQRATLDEVMTARVWLEPTAASMAASHITDQEITLLREINEEMRAAVDRDDEGIRDANERFHRIIADASGNLVVQVFTETLLNVADIGTEDLTHSRDFKLVAVRGHERIISALAAHDPEAARRAMTEHVTAGRRGRDSANPEMMSRPLRWVQ